jgi:TPR repeat protein
MKKIFAVLLGGLTLFTAAAADKIPLYDSKEWHALPGMKEVKEAAEKGDADACALLSQAISEAKKRAGLQMDTVDREWEFKAVAGGVDPRYVYFGDRTPEQLIEIYRKFADKGFYLAQRYIGEVMLTSGILGHLDWYEKAAEQGDDVSQYNLGLAYLNGVYRKADTAKTLKYWELSAAQGNAGALKDLGVYWKDGLGGKEDNAKGITFLKRAVEKGNTEAAFILGEIFAEGRHVSVNKDLAIKYFRKAAEKEKNVAIQIERTGKMHFDYAMYHQRNNDIAMRDELLKSAAAYGHEKAALILQRNKLMTKDAKVQQQALSEIIRMAERGNVYAQANLALLSEKRTEEANTWYCRSLGNGEMLAYTLLPSVLSTRFNEQQKRYLRGVFLRADYLDETDMQYLALELCGSENFPEKANDGKKYFDILIRKEYPKIMYQLSVLMLNDENLPSDVNRAALVEEFEKYEKILKDSAARGDKDAARILEQFSITDKLKK